MKWFRLKSRKVNELRLPRRIVIPIIVVSILPTFCGVCGVDLSMIDVTAPERPDLDPTFPEQENYYYVLAGAFIHTILEWTAFCVALVVAMLSVVHFRLKHDVTTPVIGTALFCSGMLDAFNALAASRLTFSVLNPDDFFPFTWAVARTFNVLILIAGTLPFLFTVENKVQDSRPQGIGLVILLGCLFALMAYATIYVFAVMVPTPRSLNPEAGIPRPWDAIPLVLMLFAAGVVFPRFYKLHPSVFSHSLIISMIPALASECHAAFFSTALYDHNFIAAYLLKIVAYLVPLFGIILDYTKAYRSEVTLHSTESKLRTAREIQQSLLPGEAPSIDGFEMAGLSFPAEAVGGDYFDYIAMDESSWGVVVGDVSGHDLGASLFMSQTRAYLRACAESREDCSQILTRLNHFLSNDMRDRRFVTLFFLYLDSNSAALEYGGMGHGAYLIRRSGEHSELKLTHPPLGVVDGEVKTERTPEIVSGDMVVIMTDGIVEATSPEGEQFGIERTLRVIREHRNQDVDTIISLLNMNVHRHCQGTAPADDVTIVLLKKS